MDVPPFSNMQVVEEGAIRNERDSKCGEKNCQSGNLFEVAPKNYSGGLLSQRPAKQP